MKELVNKIEQWSIDRNLHTADPKAQFVKLIEEVGELANGINKNNEEVIEDSIGDVMVVLIILSQQLGYNLETALGKAYNEIKDRRGRMVNGVFVKESDL